MLLPALSSITSPSSSLSFLPLPTHLRSSPCSPLLLIRFSACVAGVKHNYHTDDGRRWGKDGAARERERERGKKKSGGEHRVLVGDDGVDRVHVHNHKLHCLI